MANNDNIIYAKFNHGCEITTDSRSQYAYGQVLKISGLHLPASFDADISNKGDKQAKAIIGTDNELPIDDAFFLSGKDIIVMINVHAADKDGRTKYIIRIPVEKRPERADIELEPVEQDVISVAIATLNEAVEQTSASAESAENSANRAHESAVNAETSATSASNSEVLAQQYMERAETAAENAEQSKTKAKASEDNAKASETHAEQIATEIEQYTERAETASTNAQSSASTATQKATEASAFANIATTKANEASTSATNAQNSANNAQQFATDAQQSANSASASASRALVNAEKTQNDKEIIELVKSNVLSAVGEAQTYATTAQFASQAIQDMNVQATTLEPDSDVTVEKSVDPVTGAVTLTYGIPKGVKGEKGDTGNKGDKGDAFTYADFTPEQLASLKGERGEQGIQGVQGEKGDAFTYADFTPQQLASLKGEKGDKGDQGIQGIQGEQGIQGIQGEKGEKGDKGDAFTYSDFTPAQLASLKGEKGDTGNTGAKGDTGDSGVYIGTSAPIDENVDVWIDSDGEPDFSLGVPPTAQTVAEMDETESSIWVYTGSETGYTAGNWYYHNGSAWTSGGVYGAGVTDSVPTQGSTNAVSSGGVYDALADKADKDSTPETVTPEETDADFYLSDSNGNVLLELADGHIRTKNFDSSDINTETDTTLSVQGKPADAKAVGDAIAGINSGASVKDASATDADLYICDSFGNVVGEFGDGHIRTKNFDSANMEGIPEDVSALQTDVSALQSATNGILYRVKDQTDGVYASCRWRQPTLSSKQFCMLIAGDIHTDPERMLNLVKYLNAVDAFDAGIMLGDMSGVTYDSPINHYADAIALTEKPFLTVIGNHDVEGGATSDADLWSKYGDLFQYADLANGEAVNGKCYYYKDFASYKIRVIVLMQYDLTFNGYLCFGQTQIDWLIGVLNSTPSDYGVIICEHTNPSRYMTYEMDTKYTSSTWKRSNYALTDMDGDPIPDIVNAWINGTTLSQTYGYTFDSPPADLSVSADFTSRGAGEFITYLGGHWHMDVLGYPTGYADQMDYHAPACGLTAATQGDMPRRTGTVSEDSFCVLGVDRDSKTVKIFHIGAHYTKDATDRQCFQYSYGGA